MRDRRPRSVDTMRDERLRKAVEIDLRLPMQGILSRFHALRPTFRCDETGTRWYFSVRPSATDDPIEHEVLGRGDYSLPDYVALFRRRCYEIGEARGKWTRNQENHVSHAEVNRRIKKNLEAVGIAYSAQHGGRAG